jgi:gamma-glutamylcyclotransferase (GGCT)/AIG2-like uncharacterized protein YtfP
MLYFAYGSNMNHEQMLQRCPSSKYIRKCYLKDYKFVYDGYSSKRGGAVANIIESNGSIVWGGVFEINKDNLSALDCYEGYPDYYDRKQVDVIDDNSSIYKAIVYYRTDKKIGQPSKGYRQVVEKGANDCELPKDYINSYI